MRLRMGLNRPPPLAKRHHHEEEFEYAHNNLYKATRGRRDLPLPPRPRHSPFRPGYDDEEYGGFPGGRKLKDSVTGEYFENDDALQRGRYTPTRGSQRTVRFGTSGLPPNSDWYDPEDNFSGRNEMEDDYRGGYDFRDDIDSIDTYEGKRRQQLRRARAQPRQASIRSSSPGVSSLKKITRYDRQPVNSRGSSSRQRDAGRLVGSTMASTIATQEEAWEIMQSMSSFSCPRVNPQLLHAKRVPELPPGYVQRNDGVVVSLLSSVDSRTGEERYADAEPLPTEAADGVVEDLRALGYHVDDRNGILGSNSDPGEFSRYGGSPSWSLSTEALSQKSKSSRVSKSRMVKNKFLKQNTQAPPDSSCGASATGAGTKSTCSKQSKSKQGTSVSSKNSRRSQKQVSLLTLSELNNSIVESESNGNTDTDTSTDIADGSTITSRPTLEPPKAGTVVVDIQNTNLVSEKSDEPQNVEDNPQHPAKRVGFSGEYPEMTKTGERVPELVVNNDGIKTVVSDLSNQRSLDMESFAYNNQQDPFSLFFDRLLYGCRIAAFPSPKMN